MIGKITFKLVKGWVALESHTLELKKYYRILNEFQCQQGILRFNKELEEHKLSIYDFFLFLEICKAHKIETIIDNDLKLYCYVLLKKNSGGSVQADLSLWNKDKNLQIYDYQKVGAEKALYIKNFIIADAMGLGKSAQCIAVLCHCLANFKTKKHVFILPSKLRLQWYYELLKFTCINSNDLVVFDDPRIKIGKKQAGNLTVKEYRNKLRIDSIYDSKVLLISFNMVKKYLHHLLKQKYDLVVIDEASKIKNETDVTSGIKKLCNSMSKLGIKIFATGTPIENRLEDLYNVFNIIDKRIFGWRSEFKVNYTQCDLDGKIIGYKNINSFKKKIKPFYIRRTSDLVWKDRPKLNEKYELCEMVGKQKTVYKDALNGVLSDLQDLERQTQINNASLAPLMQILLSASGTCKAIVPEYEGNDHSCKIKMLIDILNDFDHSDKMIIFSRYAYKVNPYIYHDLVKKSNCQIFRIDGAVKDASSIIEKFKKSRSVLLASDAISYGVNIQCANYLVNFDLPWNPAVFSQRVGRIYRKGQKRNVNIINLLSIDTFDTVVYEQLYRKQSMFNKIFQSDLSSFKVDNNTEAIKDMIYAHAKNRGK